MTDSKSGQSGLVVLGDLQFTKSFAQVGLEVSMQAQCTGWAMDLRGAQWLLRAREGLSTRGLPTGLLLTAYRLEGHCLKPVWTLDSSSGDF